jgi:hypothetical protein
MGLPFRFLLLDRFYFASLRGIVIYVIQCQTKHMPVYIRIEQFFFAGAL